MCHSPHHSTNVPLVLNTQSGNVSPQFHCIYDDDFATCKRDAKFDSLWQFKAKLQSRPNNDNFDVPILPTTVVNESAASLPPAAPPLPIFITPWEPPSEPMDNSIADSTTPEQSRPMATPPAPILPVPPPPEVITRSGRRVRKPQYFSDMHANSTFLHTFSPKVDHSDPISVLQPDAAIEPHPFASISNYVISMTASSDPDTMTLEEALAAPDRDKFVEAMVKELKDHVDQKHWKVVPLKSIPSHKRAIPMVWSMKRKRDPLGNIIEWKSRLCAGGHRSIETIDYWSTYSPVVSWSTVRLMIVFALTNNWHMRSIDFVLAFPQAPIKTDIFMKPPKVPSDFSIPDLPAFSDRFLKVYKLLKNLYGLKDAGKTWFDFLKKGLLSRGCQQSAIDTCLFTKDGIVLIVYVDDAILISPDKSLIDAEIKSLQEGYVLTDDGDLQDYLGTRFTQHADGSVELSQPRMVSRILAMVGLDSDSERVKTHDTPACDTRLLDNDPNGLPRMGTWKYRSVVGALSYLQAMVRPDITMSVQQCARFCNNPQKQHEEAVKRICRYLLKTKDRGLIFRPDPSRGLECYVDADWAGSWQDRLSNDPLSTHSRTGYVILYAGCPIVWASKMQTLVSLSTTEAENIALSSSLREVIGILNLLNELKDRKFTFNGSAPKVHCRVFEDNMSCIEIATNHRTRPRTKHLSVRLHHFRSHVIQKTISIQHVSTTEQLADMFTKPLARIQFQKFWDRLMGWSPSRKGVRE